MSGPEGREGQSSYWDIRPQRVPHTLPLWNWVPKTKTGMVFLGPNSINSVYGPSGDLDLKLFGSVTDCAPSIEHIFLEFLHGARLGRLVQ